MAFCGNCGHEIPAGATTCPECGHPVGAVAPTAGLVYADFWSRFAALLIDVIVLTIPGVIFRSAFRFAGGFALQFLYHWLLVAYWDGFTLGKRALNIRVARPDGSRVDMAVAAARAGMRLVSGLAFGLGFLWAAWDPQKRTWHDMVADTRVFRV